MDSGVAGEKGPDTEGNQGSTKVVTFGNGSQWVRKRVSEKGKTDLDREELAAKVSAAIGAGAPPVIRTGPTEIHMPFVEGKAALAAGHSLSHPDLSKLPPDDVRRIGLLDRLIGNMDRHSGNFMIGPQGELVPIDHNMSWQGNLSLSSPFAAKVKPGDFTRPELQGMQAELAKLEPEFKRLLGGDKEFRQTMDALKIFLLLTPAPASK
jgi:hypothetical protein